MSVYDDYEMTIGIECHVQLATKTKLFSSADNDARDAEPNSKVVPIDFGLPGMLPVLNREAVTLAVKAGKALNADIAHISRFDRKHYFYPDLPKGYQTSQMYQPIILAGYIDAPLDNGESVRVRIHHAHMEEDAGKLTHYGDYSLVDLNRAGTPLIEIVSEPDIHSASAARAYATELYRLMTYAGVTHGDLYHGNMRFDVNVSVAKSGEPLGTRTETKNLNSFKAVERAVEYEATRQIELLEKGEKVVQETRGWNEDRQVTFSQRSKEDAHDYRYFPDADLPPIYLAADEVAAIAAEMPLLPDAYRASFAQLGLDSSVVSALLNTRQYGDIVLDVQSVAGDEAATRTAHWLSSVLGQSNDEPLDVSRLDTPRLAALSEMVQKAELSSSAAKEIFIDLMKESTEPRSIAEKKNLLQVSDESEIGGIVDTVLADPANAKAIEDVRSGNERVIGFLVGQVMKQSAGKANPSLVQKLIKERL